MIWMTHDECLWIDKSNVKKKNIWQVHINDFKTFEFDLMWVQVKFNCINSLNLEAYLSLTIV